MSNTPSAQPSGAPEVQLRQAAQHLLNVIAADQPVSLAVEALQSALATAPSPSGAPADTTKALEPCPRGDDKPESTCTNRHQCWEPCGELGHSAEHARVGSVSPEKIRASLAGPPFVLTQLDNMISGLPTGRVDQAWPDELLAVLQRAHTTFTQVEIDAECQHMLSEWWSEMEARLAEMKAVLEKSTALAGAPAVQEGGR